MVNFLAVGGAAIASIVLGFIWYGPLFGKQWMSIMGLKPSDMEKMKTGVQTSYVGGLVSSLVMSYVLALLIEGMNTSAFYGNAYGLALAIWLGFVATVTLGGVLWENKPWHWWLLNNGYQLLSLLLMAGILVSFP